MEVTAWPDRARHPYTESSRTRKESWTYQVQEPSAGDGPYRVVVRSDTSLQLFHFSSDYNLRSVFEVLDRDSDSWKTRTLHRSPTGGGPFLIRNWQPDRAVFFSHPDLTTRDSFVRRNFTSGGRSTENWMVQRVTEDGDYRFELKHEPSRTRTVFRWEPGRPWWSEARYYYRGRLIVRALRES